MSENNKLEKIFYNIYFKCTDVKFWYENNKDDIIEKMVWGMFIFNLIVLFVWIYNIFR